MLVRGAVGGVKAPPYTADVTSLKLDMYPVSGHELEKDVPIEISVLLYVAELATEPFDTPLT